MRAVLAILCGLFVCGVIDESIGSRLPAGWGTIVGGLVGVVVGLGIYRWRVSR